MSYPYYVYGERGGMSKKVPCTSAGHAQMHHESMSRNGWRKVSVCPDMGDSISKTELDRRVVQERQEIRERIEAEHAVKTAASDDGNEAV